MVLIAVACDDHVLLFCFSPDSQGLEEARKFTWVSLLHPPDHFGPVPIFSLASGTTGPQGSEAEL